MISTLFFDLDETLYPAASGIWGLIGVRIEEYMRDRLQIAAETIPALRHSYFETYGTTLRGLQINRGIDTDDFLGYVHDVPVEERLQTAPRLRQVIEALPQRKIIFTNADTRHARRVLNALELAGCFEQIIDIHQVAPACKPQPEAYLKALAISGTEKPGQVVVFDDSPRNLLAAGSLGFHTVLVGKDEPDPAFQLTLASLEALPADFAMRLAGNGHK